MNEHVFYAIDDAEGHLHSTETEAEALAWAAQHPALTSIRRVVQSWESEHIDEMNATVIDTPLIVP